MYKKWDVLQLSMVMILNSDCESWLLMDEVKARCDKIKNLLLF